MLTEIFEFRAISFYATRRAVGVDINPDALMVARNRLDFSYATLDADYVAPEIKTYFGDARCLDLIGKETIDLIGDSQQALHSNNAAGSLDLMNTISPIQPHNPYVLQSMENICKTTIYF